MNQEDMEKLLKILGNQIESKNTTERLVTGSIKEDGNIFEVKKSSSLENGGITENTTFNLRILDCGCISHGRKNVSGVDYKGYVVCPRHFFRCLRCHRPLSIKTVKPQNGICYCSRCSFIRKLFPKR